jgi:hypothetical protein
MPKPPSIVDRPAPGRWQSRLGHSDLWACCSLMFEEHAHPAQQLAGFWDPAASYISLQFQQGWGLFQKHQPMPGLVYWLCLLNQDRFSAGVRQTQLAVWINGHRAAGHSLLSGGSKWQCRSCSISCTGPPFRPSFGLRGILTIPPFGFASWTSWPFPATSCLGFRAIHRGKANQSFLRYLLIEV